MKISEFLHPSDVVGDLAGATAPEVLAELCRPAASAGPVGVPVLLESLLARESLGSTGIGEGIAIPHGRVAGLPGLRASVGRSRVGIDFNSADSKPAHLFIALFAPANGPGIHLHALARLCRVLKSTALRDALMGARGAEEIYQLIEAEDAKL